MRLFASSSQRVVGLRIHIAVACAVIFCLSNTSLVNSALAGSHEAPGTPGASYPNMPWIAPIGVRIGKYLEVPESAKGPAIDAAKGYRLQKLGEGLYMITDNVYQSMFMVYETGIVVVDAPPSYAPTTLRRSAPWGPSTSIGFGFLKTSRSSVMTAYN